MSVTDPLKHCRQSISRLLGVDDPSSIVLTEHATHALNLAMTGLLCDGSAAPGNGGAVHVITTVTEHNSVLRPLRHLEAAGRAEITIVGLTEDGSLDGDAFEELMKTGPGLVVMNHISNVTGRVNDVGRYFEMAKEAGAVTLLDASQSVGHMKVNARETCCDMIALTGHKGLHGPPGTGALYVDPHIELGYFIVGGSGSRSDLELHPGDMPARLEAGTPNIPAFTGLAAALDWVETRESAFLQNEYRLGEHLREKLNAINGVRVFDSAQNSESIGVVSFRVDGWDPFETAFVLEGSFGIQCRAGLHCAPLMHQAIGSWPDGTVRLSVSGFSTDDDVDAGLDAVRHLAGARPGRM